VRDLQSASVGISSAPRLDYRSFNRISEAKAARIRKPRKTRQNKRIRARPG
jgi:hypothetical protein